MTELDIAGLAFASDDYYVDQVSDIWLLEPQ